MRNLDHRELASDIGLDISKRQLPGVLWAASFLAGCSFTRIGLG